MRLQRKIEDLKKRKPREPRFMKERRRRRVEAEIYEGISMLRNLISLGGANPGTDKAVQILSEKNGCLRPAYLGFLAKLRLNRKEEALEAFTDAAGAPRAREFAGLLLKLDELSGSELNEILISHQKSIKEARITEQRRFDETVSDLIYLPAVLNVVVVFVNFIYIAYLMQQREILNMLF